MLRHVVVMNRSAATMARINIVTKQFVREVLHDAQAKAKLALPTN
jgi:hypothetical protein